MDKNIFEEGPRRGHAAGDTSIEQQASQLASDIRYKARQKMKGTSGSNMSPAQVQALYRSLLGSSTAPGAVKALVKKKLFKEQVDRGIVPVAEHLESSRSDVLTRVFSEAEDKKFVVRVTDKATGNTSYRKADRAKIAELRANKNISSVEITGRKEADDAYKGDPKPNPSGGKKAKKDYDGDGKIESGTDEWKGSRDKAIKKSMAKEEVEVSEAKVDTGLDDEGKEDVRNYRKFGTNFNQHKTSVLRRSLHRSRRGDKKVKGSKYTEEFIADAKQEDDGEKKLDVMKGKNTVKVNPSLGESIKAELAALKAKKDQEVAEAAAAAGPSPEEKQQLMMKDKMLKKKIMMQKQALQMQKQGKLPANYNEACDTCGGDHDTKDHDKSKKESDGTFNALKDMKPDAKDIDPREVPTRINLAKNKLRAMGLKMSYDMEGEMTEATYPSDFKKGSPVATKKTGRPIQHDQPTKGGRRKTVDENRLSDEALEKAAAATQKRHKEQGYKVPGTGAMDDVRARIAAREKKK